MWSLFESLNKLHSLVSPCPHINLLKGSRALSRPALSFWNRLSLLRSADLRDPSIPRPARASGGKGACALPMGLRRPCGVSPVLGVPLEFSGPQTSGLSVWQATYWLRAAQFHRPSPNPYKSLGLTPSLPRDIFTCS